MVTKRKVKKRRRRPGVPCPLCDHQFSEIVRVCKVNGGVLPRLHRCAGCKKSFLSYQSTKKTDTGSTSSNTSVETLRQLLSDALRVDPRALNFHHEGEKK